MQKPDYLHPYEQRVLRWLRENRVALSGCRVLAALSGGADSVAMTLLLQSLAKENDFTLCAAHVNHQIRGEEAERDAEFCRAFCEARGIPFRLLVGDARQVAATRRQGLEEAARTMRYELLQSAANTMQADWIATAHTADDQLETVLLNLMRGSAARGLSGIPPVNGRILRPILPLERADTETIARLAGTGYVTDSTNASDAYARNRLRNQVIPVLRSLNGNVARNALENGSILREEDQYLAELAADALATVRNGERLSVSAVQTLPEAMRSRVVRLWGEEFGLRLDRRKTAAILALLISRCPSSLCELSDGKICRRIYGELAIETASEPPEDFSVPLPLGKTEPVGRKYTAEGRFLAGSPAKTQQVYKLFNHCFLNCDTIKGMVCIRNRRPGDRFARNASSGSKSLKQVFTDLKIPADTRRELPGGADEAGVLWVYGIGPNHLRPLYRPETDGYEICFREI